MITTTSKNVNKMTVVASLALLSVILVSLPTNSAYGESEPDLIEHIPIKEYVKEEKSDDRIRINEIHLLLKDDNITLESKITLEREADQIRQNAKSHLNTSMSADEIIKHTDKKDKSKKQYEKLQKAISKNKKFAQLFAEELVGFGIDDKTGKLFIDINPAHANQTNAVKYDKKIKNILGNNAKFDFKQIERATHSTCTGLSEECRPIQGGVQIGIGLSTCSVGFKASDGDDEGFITAGHCGEIGDDVNQPFWWWQKVGEITKDGLTSSDTSTYCDCAFVNMTGTISTDDTIYSNIHASDIGSIVYNDYVTMLGKASGTVSGQIKTVSYSTQIAGIWHFDHFRVDALMAVGDSGGPTYETGDSTPSLMGFSSAIQNGYTIVSKASYVDYEMSGVSLDFD